MSTLVICPECQRKLRVPESAAGKSMRCPGCKAVLPGSKKTSTEETEETSAKAVQRETREAASARPSPRKSVRKTEAFDDEEDRPRRKRTRTRQGMPAGLIYALIGGGGLLILLLVIGGIALRLFSGRDKTIPDAEWQAFAPPNGDCTILMPGTPIPQALNMGGINLTQYQVERNKGNVFFMMAVYDLPLNVLRPNLLQNVVNVTRDHVATQTNGKVTSETTIALGNMMGREFQMKIAGQGTLISRFYLGKIGNTHRIYTVSVGGDPIQPNKGDAVRFFDSFRVTAPVSAPTFEDGAAMPPNLQPPNFNLPPPNPFGPNPPLPNPMRPNMPQPNQRPMRPNRPG